MCADDVVEARLGPKPELDRAFGLEPLRPTADDALDQRIALPADASSDLVTGDSSQRRDLLAHRAGHARHGEIDPVPERLPRQRRRMHQKADRGPRARMGVAHALRHRQHRFLAGQRLADDRGEEAGRRLVGPARPHADRGKPQAHAVEKSAALVSIFPAHPAGCPGATTSTSTSLSIALPLSALSRTSRSTSLRPTMPAAPMINICTSVLPSNLLISQFRFRVLIPHSAKPPSTR